MKGRDTRVIVAEMVDALALIRQYVSQLTEEEFRRNVMVQDALTRRIEIVGEAASQLDEAFRQHHPEIPWQKIIAMRNRLIHGYFTLDLNVVWDTAEKDTPVLEQQLRDILQRLPPHK